MNIYKVNNFPILHPILQKAFQHSLVEECPALSSDGDYANVPSDLDVLTCVFTKAHMCRLDTALYPTEKIMCCLYTFFINKTKL